MDGWSVIVKKGEFAVEDVCIFFEIDSMLPLDPMYAFLRKSTKTSGGEGYRLKTMKMRGTTSQGLALPLHMFTVLDGMAISEFEDVNLDELLGVWLYEPVRQGSASAFSEPLGPRFPLFLQKTDQSRIQNQMFRFEEDIGTLWEVTKKLDGSSCTMYHNSNLGATDTPSGFWSGLFYKLRCIISPPSGFGVCSRNINLREKEGNAFWDMAKELGAEEIIGSDNIALQGELIGPKIQNNHEKVDQNQFYLFDIYDIDAGEYLTVHERMAWLELNDPSGVIQHVPQVAVNYDVFNNNKDLASLEKFVTGMSMNKDTISEGMVFKRTDDARISFKCISQRYLLKCEE